MGRVAFVTGGTRGIGRAIVERLKSDGFEVAAGYSGNEAAAQACASELGVMVVKGNVGSFEDCGRAVEAVTAELGPIEVLVNNAGISRGGNIEQLSFEDWKLVMEVNVDSVFLGTKHALKYMRQNQPGSIINISSIAGLIAAHNSPAYNASKAGVWLLSKGIALHCAKQGLDIRSNSIHPTFIDTPILDRLRDQLGKEVAEGKLARQIPLGHIGEPEDVANAAVYLASDESKFMTGAEIKLDGGISAM